MDIGKETGGLFSGELQIKWSGYDWEIQKSCGKISRSFFCLKTGGVLELEGVWNKHCQFVRILKLLLFSTKKGTFFPKALLIAWGKIA